MKLSMTKQTTAIDPQIYEMTAAEIGRQIQRHAARRVEIVSERAALYSIATKAGGSAETTIADADERAARQHAKNLLNGAAPESLSLPQEIDRDRILLREQRGIDLAIKILSDKGLVARASEAVTWAEAHDNEWRGLAREITMTAVRLAALERRAGQLLGSCGDIFSIRLPMVNIIGGRPVSETPLSDLVERALAEGLVIQADLRKSENG
jgi:hypothetical protein